MKLQTKFTLDRLESLGDAVHQTINDMMVRNVTGFLPIVHAAIMHNAPVHVVLASQGWIPTDPSMDRWAHVLDEGNGKRAVRKWVRWFGSDSITVDKAAGTLDLDPAAVQAVRTACAARVHEEG